MAKKVISCGLSWSSIDKAIKEIEKYKDSLQQKCERIVELLLEKGEKVVLERVEASPLGASITVRSEKTPEKMGCKGLLLMTGGFNQPEGREPFYFSLAIEFGAGIYYNKVPNPNADKFGLGVGTYPGQVHAYQNVWFYWDDKAQEWKPTHGVKATMPMYNASLEMRKRVVETVREVFGS